MRTAWIVSLLTVLASMGLLVVIVGQFQQLVKVRSQLKRQQNDMHLKHERGENQELFRTSVETLEAEANKVAEETETQVTMLSSEMEKKKTESEVCETDKKRTNDEVDERTKVHTETEATFKSEAEAWTNEINTLKEQLKEFSPVCKHVKPDPLAEKLCGIEHKEAPKPPAAPANQEAPAAPANQEAPAAPANQDAPAAPANQDAPAAPANQDAPAAPGSQ